MQAHKCWSWTFWAYVQSKKCLQSIRDKDIEELASPRVRLKRYQNANFLEKGLEEGDSKASFSLKLQTLYAVPAEKKHTKILQRMLEEQQPFQRTVVPNITVLALLAFGENVVAARGLPSAHATSVTPDWQPGSRWELSADLRGWKLCGCAQGRNRIKKA